MFYIWIVEEFLTILTVLSAWFLDDISIFADFFPEASRFWIRFSSDKKSPDHRFETGPSAIVRGPLQAQSCLTNVSYIPECPDLEEVALAVRADRFGPRRLGGQPRGPNVVWAGGWDKRGVGVVLIHIMPWLNKKRTAVLRSQITYVKSKLAALRRKIGITTRSAFSLRTLYESWVFQTFRIRFPPDLTVFQIEFLRNRCLVRTVRCSSISRNFFREDRSVFWIYFGS